MNTVVTKKSKARNLKNWLILLPVLFLTSCVETIFTVQFPRSGETYVGDELVDFIIGYSTTVSTADVFLNGVDISDDFIYGPSNATASIVKIKKYIKQGTNTLTVDPLAFGPTVTFQADTQGPEIVVTYGETTGNSVEIAGTLRDSSNVVSLDLEMFVVLGYDIDTGEVTRVSVATESIPVNADGTFHAPAVDISSGVTIYKFTATDEHGYSTEKEYLADSSEISALAISNAMRIAIGDSFIESLRPLIAFALYNSLAEAPIDVRNGCWDDPNKEDAPSQNPSGGFCSTGQDGSTFNPGLNPVNVSMPVLGNIPTTINRLNMAPGLSTALLNSFKILPNDRIDIDMVITEMRVDMTMDLGWLGNMDLDMEIDRTVADTQADARALNKKVNVQLVNSNFDLQGITVHGANLGILDLTVLVDAIIPLLEGVIADLLPSILNPILNDNLQKIVIGGRMLSTIDTNVEYFDWALNVETLKTDTLIAGESASYDMIIGLETYFDLLTEDPLARPSLGPVYIEDPIDSDLVFNALGQTGTNLSVAISSNAINQGFNALYGAGLSHFSFVDGETTYGADPSLPAGTDGQTRVRLYPESPPFFTLRRLDGGVAGAAEASVGYESAVLYMDLNEGGVWKEQLRLGVDFKIAASIEQEGGSVKIGISGSPELNVNTVVNNTGLPVTQGMLQGLVDVVFIYFLPQLTDNFVIIDLDLLAQDQLNGTQVAYLSDTDSGNQNYQTDKPCDGGETTCVNGFYHVCDTLGDPSAPVQSGPDLVCEAINFELNTSLVSSIGSEGSNLFFQMEARDPAIPQALAIPQLDLDDDGITDFKDNCAAPTLTVIDAINASGGLVIDVTVDSEGNPIGTFADDVATYVEEQLALENCGSTSCTPSASELDWWNTMRVGDNEITALGAYPWTEMLFSNANQLNTDGDRVGELCEDDDDRDGIYADNGSPIDTCTTVTDPSNDPGSCTIDEAEFVMFQNKYKTDNSGSAKCMDHGGYNSDNDANVSTSFGLGNTNGYGTVMSWSNCDVNDPHQRFYVEVSDADETHDDRFGEPERVIHIYTNEYKQTEPGFYDLVNHHYLASTIATGHPTSAYWTVEDVIVTTMSGYENTWMQWILSESDISGYPYMIESNRVWVVYGQTGGLDEGRRDCIFSKLNYLSSTYDNVDADAGSCFPDDATNRERAAFKVLLGTQQVEWSGRFAAD